jgi:ubiquinone/menaquinone biosynthesis C-methylase UbiE
MYVRSAEFYDDLFHFKNYEAEAGELKKMICALHPDARTLLDVGCSTGRHLEYLKNIFEVHGLDINEELLAVARKRLFSFLCTAVT